MNLRESWYIPRGQAFVVFGETMLHPADAMRLKNNGRTPLYTRHMLGTREIERDRRANR